VPHGSRLHRQLRALLALALAGLVPAGASAQDAPPADSAAKPPSKPDDGRLKITPLIAPAYNPEMEFLIAGGVLLSFRTDKADSALPRSTLSTTISYSTIGAINVAGRFSSYWKRDRLRLLADLSYKDMEDAYWGVGYDAGLEPTDKDSTTIYQRRWFAFRPTVLKAVRRHLYLGGTLDLNRTEATEVNPVMAADSAFLATGPASTNVGVGVILQYDSRDVPGNAWTGLYLSTTATAYATFLGSDWSYRSVLLDYRQYKPLGRPGRTLAWQVRSRITFGDVPWAELSLLGSGYDFRGYREGRFRDNQAGSAVVEYRHTFQRADGRLSRHGYVLFAGVGVMASERFDFAEPLPMAGFGYRFELQPRANVRVDFGFGRKTNGIYFNFQEAF